VVAAPVVAPASAAVPASRSISALAPVPGPASTPIPAPAFAPRSTSVLAPVLASTCASVLAPCALAPTSWSGSMLAAQVAPVLAPTAASAPACVTTSASASATDRSSPARSASVCVSCRITPLSRAPATRRTCRCPRLAEATCSSRAARTGPRVLLPSAAGAPVATASFAPIAANTPSGNSKPCSVPCRTSMFIDCSAARVGSSANRSSVLSSRGTSLSCARRCAERAARASLSSVSVDTVAARRVRAFTRGGRGSEDAAESAIEN
jgi:hypothetical protein